MDEYAGRPWWLVPSQNWNYETGDAGMQGDWMGTLTPGPGHSYADYQAWLADLTARGLLDATGRPTKPYYEEIHNQSFNPVLDASGRQTGAVRDYTYQPRPAPV